jgi:hypothetical protein
MPFKLGDINAWHANVYCTPTALAAKREASLLQEAAKLYGREIYEQLREIKLLGGDWTPGDDFSEPSICRTAND